MVIAVDFDGTIVEHEYPRIGKPIPFAFYVLKKLLEERHTLILWTMRKDDLLQEAIDYCAKNGVTFYAHNKNYPEEEWTEGGCRKISADFFIDDRNVGGLPDWGIIYKIIQSGVNTYDLDMISNTDRAQRKKNLFTRIGEAWDKTQYGY